MQLCTERVKGSQNSKVHGDNMGPTWVLSAPYGPHVDHMNLALREAIHWDPHPHMIAKAALESDISSGYPNFSDALAKPAGRHDLYIFWYKITNVSRRNQICRAYINYQKKSFTGNRVRELFYHTCSPGCVPFLFSLPIHTQYMLRNIG